MPMMIEEIGIVERVEDGYIWVSPASSGGACGSCQSSGSCSTSILVTLLQGKTSKTVRVNNTINAKVKDKVVLGIHPQGLLSGSALIYLLPILTLFIFAALGGQFFNERVSMVAGVVGFIIGLYISKKIAGSTVMKSRLALVGLRVQPK
ncbi:MAG: SoxR reducing system RseC family protein [Cocleimonas sp.]|nr:SoxR reducing system RseC family protein [Cocleimonas sp.]